MREKLVCEQIARAAMGEPARREGAEILYHCPRPENHHNADVHPSLKINSRKNVWACFPCHVGGAAWQLAAFIASVDPADKKAVTAWLRERGLVNHESSAKLPGAARGQIMREYIYRNASGNPVARKLRIEPGPDGRKKTFAWQRYQNRAWSDGLGSVKTPLYRLSEITGEPLVILTEGEKDADAGARIGLATTTSGGVGSFRKDHADALHGKAVCIIADSDTPGREQAQKVAAMVHGKTLSVKIVEFLDAKDLAEAIERGLTLEKFLKLYEQSPRWQPAPGAEIVDSVFHFVRCFVSLTESQARALVLWVAHTHTFEAADCTPYMTITSAEKQSGKTRLLEVLETLVARPWLTGRVTAAVLIRKIDKETPTLLLDESDTAFGGEKEYAEALRGVLDSGYRASGKASCCVGQGANIGYEDFATFCPKAVAGIGKLPDTVADRSIPIRLKRAPRGEITRFRKREVECEAKEIRSKLAVWAQGSIEKLRDARPEIPHALTDRQADCCEPLLAIADLLGREWPETARQALVELCGEAQAADTSIGVRLLSDIREIFQVRGVDRLPSADLATALAEIETSPWGEWSQGKGLTVSRLARLLGRFDIVPGTIRVSEKTAKGYYAGDFADAWSLYLPSDSPQAPSPVTSKRHNVTACVNTDENTDFETAPEPLCDGTKNVKNTNKNAPCDAVTVSESGTQASARERAFEKGEL